MGPHLNSAASRTPSPPPTTTNGKAAPSGPATNSSSENNNNNSASKFPGKRLITTNISKYPSGRDVPFQNAVQWLQARRADDALGHDLWRVHDKLYDLSTFAPSHPGGAEWISMTVGTDVTEAFEASHILRFSSVERTLDKYFVRSATTPRTNSIYTFDKSGFYSTLKRRAEPVLKEVGTGPTSSMIQIQDTLAATFGTCALLSVWLNSTTLQVLAGLLLGMTIICAHNFFHIKDNWRKFYFDLSHLSSYEWRISHALSHHLFTNTIMDYEIYMLEPFYEVCPGVKRTWAQKYLVHPFLYVSYFANFWLGLSKRVTYWVRGVQEPRAENGIPFLQLVLFAFVAPSVGAALKSWIVIHSVASFYFGFVGLMAAHHHPSAFHEGDEARPNPDFGLCQLDSTKSRAESWASNLLFIVCTFGSHPLHHLFPTVCHSKLHHLEPVLEKTLEEFEESFPPLNKKEFLVGIHAQLVREQPNRRVEGGKKKKKLVH